MPKGPAGQRRPAHVVSNAVHVMGVFTGEADDAHAALHPAMRAVASGQGASEAAKSTSPKDIYVSKSPSDSPTKEVARSDRPETEESFWPLPPRKRLTSERMRVAEANGRASEEEA